jgi:hypothetical protein
MVESHSQLSRVLQTWLDASKMIAVSETLSCLLTSRFDLIWISSDVIYFELLQHVCDQSDS